jgi:hypothetical protein
VTNESGCVSGRPKTYGSYESGSGYGSGTLLTRRKKAPFFLNIINWVSKSLATGTGTSTTFNVIESGSNSPETVLFRD